MKARKINVAPYLTGPLLPERDDEGKLTGQHRQQEFNVRMSLAELLFHPELKLGKADALKHEKIASKILDADGDFVLLSEEEWTCLKRGVDVHRGWTRPQLPLINRVDDAEEVEVGEVEKK